jgi:hypothetical protein
MLCRISDVFVKRIEYAIRELLEKGNVANFYVFDFGFPSCKFMVLLSIM